MNEDAYLLARARAVRIVPLTAVGAADGLSVLRRAADDVQRRLVDVEAAGGPAVMVRWAPDVEPVSGAVGDPLTHREAAPSQLLTLGAAVRLCWPDPELALYPGGAVAEEDVLAACVPPGDGLLREGMALIAQTSAYRSALRILRACGYLAADAGDGMVRLGPVVAAWSERDVDELRRGYDLLPCQVEEG
ncbi:hypothetical protein OHA09_36015 [Streptomyces longwoodensis]|uniref:hypothetical protein n=1 Tax=Streptomyces longwoodensis TaxID=68231 RepID=UPI002E822456|nr:hypothetical protein [Streptomyces longwoodensis]WUC55759.1 hypothetical protein OHA09_00960 [Streptomyces longwoodensis]WUC62122.1 hypothetical protein OHA09_36015 [Streptomyces longwoodensis]